MKFDLNLKKLRQTKGLTQNELAKLLAVPQSVISDYETGKLDPSLKRAIELAIIFDVTLDELIKYEKAREAYTKEL